MTCEAGSPPQVRGKLHSLLLTAFLQRITPAGAGKTYLKISFLSVLQDHPRRCGENSLNSSSCRRRSGSPPQVRGKQRRSGYDTEQSRITPAGAGKTRNSRRTQIMHWDHPRRCGENHPRTKSRECILGSPPQVRGKLEDALNSGSLVGITPAGAGKTLEQTRGKARDRDHPRRCGENSNSYNLHDVAWGSPPQVRGKPERADRNAVWCGITPAGAGKTVAVRMESIRLWDHPRRCGENLQQRLQQRLRLGSPPQVRGKLQAIVDALPQIRITPAGAGKTPQYFFRTVFK